MIRTFLIAISALGIVSCSSTKNSHDKGSIELLEVLKANQWASSECESHAGHPYTKHSIAVTDQELIFTYSDFEADCTEQFGEFTEIRPFTLGSEFVAESGVKVSEIDILTKAIAGSEREFNIKNLIYINEDMLFFGVTGPEINCEPENLLVDIKGGLGGYIPEVYVCDQRPTRIDFENAHTKK